MRPSLTYENSTPARSPSGPICNARQCSKA
jgi:hypothetical protein